MEKWDVHYSLFCPTWRVDLLAFSVFLFFFVLWQMIYWLSLGPQFLQELELQPSTLFIRLQTLQTIFLVKQEVQIQSGNGQGIALDITIYFTVYNFTMLILCSLFLILKRPLLRYYYSAMCYLVFRNHIMTKKKKMLLVIMN